MRKHKSVVAILLAVMMIFTFMPTMAFANVADVQPEGQAKYFDWADDFSSVTYNGQQATVVRRTEAGPGSTGLTTATATATAGSYEGDVAPTSTVYYYDFKDAQISFLNPALNDLYRGQNNQDATIILKDMSTRHAHTNGITTSKFKNWDVKYVTDTSLENTSDVSADVAISFSCTSLSEKYTGLNPNYPAFVNTSEMKKTITVKGINSVMPKFYEMVNGVKTDVDTLMKDNKFVYDGKEHTIMIDPVDGYTLKVTVQDPTTGKFREATEADMKYKNAGDRVALKAVYIPNTEFTIGLPADARQDGDYIATTVVGSGVVPFFGWVAGNSTTKVNDGRQAYVYDLTTEQAADPTAFVQVTKALNDEDAKEIKDVFNEFYTIKVVDNKADSNLKTWEITSKGVATEAVKKAHAQLWKNYNMEAFNDNYRCFDTTLGAETRNISVKVAAAVVTNDKEDDISFEGQTKFVYKGKKTTKKGALKAKKTITVKAAADSGNAITYVATKTAAGKITVSKAGKITVKKGLKKGTYKVTVKAKTAAGNGYKAAKEKQTYTIVIKK